MISKEILEELANIKNSIKEENASWGELAYLGSHQEEILELGDIELAEWSGIPEEEYQRRQNENQSA